MSITKLSLLIGKWNGYGTASFPTIEKTDFIEELEFSYIGDDESILFQQRTWFVTNGSKGAPLHWECGYIVAYPDDTFEMFNAQNSKRVEVMKSINFMVDENKLLITFESKHFANEERMVRTVRNFFTEGNRLVWEMSMATRMTPEFQSHLRGDLQKSVTTFMI